MKRQLKYVFYSFMLLIIGCKEDKTIDRNYNKVELEEMNNVFKQDSLSEMEKNPELYKILYKEIMENIDDYEAFPATESYFMLQIDLMYKYLKSVNYRFLNQTEFLARLNVIFKYKRIENSDDIIYLSRDSNNCKIYNKNEIGNFSTIDDTNGDEFYFLLEKGFITHVFRLPDLVSYREEYPSLSIIEDKRIEKDRENGDVDIKYWRDKANDMREIGFIYKKMEHYNRYLFNNSKASLTWLKLNDGRELKILVKNYGYVADKDLLKWVIDETPIRDTQGMNNIEDYLRLFYIVTCDKQLVLHQETMDMMASYNMEQHLEDISHLITTLRLDENYLDDFSFSQKAKLYAYFFELIRRLGINDDFKSIVAVGTFYKFSELNEQYDEEFRKNNYYEFKSFKKFWEEAKETGNGINIPNP
ncbi:MULTISPECIES: hypothetical protein [unclassified Myroides]|uniref:hypothetical protein n=1 Tax=unclassified Myroides TaxID=2642485 RepID=UPI003D2F64B5